jgi:hypothetical protein
MKGYGCCFSSLLTTFSKGDGLENWCTSWEGIPVSFLKSSLPWTITCPKIQLVRGYQILRLQNLMKYFFLRYWPQKNDLKKIIQSINHRSMLLVVINFTIFLVNYSVGFPGRYEDFTMLLVIAEHTPRSIKKKHYSLASTENTLTKRRRSKSSS